jgi:hypothetical protein
MKKPYSAAMKRLQAVLMQSAQQPPAQTAADVSDTLRIYFLERYNIPAPMRTTQELFEKGGIPATSLRLQKYATLAELWDQLAFAPLPANHAEATALVQKAIARLGGVVAMVRLRRLPSPPLLCFGKWASRRAAHAADLPWG